MTIRQRINKEKNGQAKKTNKNLQHNTTANLQYKKKTFIVKNFLIKVLPKI